SQVTGAYNRIMQTELPKKGIECIVIPRKLSQEMIISASTLRQALRSGDLETVRTLVPDTTWEYFSSDEAQDVIQRIKDAKQVVHY
ncbi:MAG: [Lachnospiraceae bacterium]|nr:[citrate (pro-3S)-lyase] ligase [Lachnospiraceae bacterium]